MGEALTQVWLKSIELPYNWNIWQREILANRLNFPIGKNLNWHNGIVGSRDFMDVRIDTRKMRHALELRLLFL